MGALSADSIAFFDGLAEKTHSITGDKRERDINCTRDFLLRSKEEMLPAFNAVFLMAVLILTFLFNVC